MNKIIQTGSFENDEFSEEEHYSLFNRVKKKLNEYKNSQINIDEEYDEDEEFSYISITVPSEFIDKATKDMKKIDSCFKWE